MTESSSTGVRVVYTDLDGTMVGPFGDFFRAEDGTRTLEPAHALMALHAADVALVLVSGRTRMQLVEVSALVGADGFIGELGAVLARRGSRDLEVLRGAMPADLVGTPFQVMIDGGLPQALFHRFPGRLDWHAPWHEGHDADVMLRGNVELDEVHEWLVENGWPWLRMHDNGVLPRREIPGSADPVHVYHLLPDGIDKGLGVSADLHARGLRPDQAIAIGDSVSDLAMAAHVGTFFLTSNGARAPHTLAVAQAHPNVVVTESPLGVGWAEAVRAALTTPQAG